MMWWAASETPGLVSDEQIKAMMLLVGRVARDYGFQVLGLLVVAIVLNKVWRSMARERARAHAGLPSGEDALWQVSMSKALGCCLVPTLLWAVIALSVFATWK